MPSLVEIRFTTCPVFRSTNCNRKEEVPQSQHKINCSLEFKDLKFVTLPPQLYHWPKPSACHWIHRVPRNPGLSRPQRLLRVPVPIVRVHPARFPWPVAILFRRWLTALLPDRGYLRINL